MILLTRKAYFSTENFTKHGQKGRMYRKTEYKTENHRIYSHGVSKGPLCRSLLYNFWVITKFYVLASSIQHDHII